MPIQTHISENGRYVTYAPYESDQAKIQPASRKTANAQACALEKVIRQLETLCQITLIPKYPKYRYRPCTSLYALGFTKKVAGIARRPIIPLSQTTMQVVKSFVDSHHKDNTLYHSFQIPSVQPVVPASHLQEFDAKTRYLKADGIRKANEKRR